MSPISTGETSASAVRRDFAIRAAEFAVRFLLGLALSGARVFGALSPFALGLTACAGSGGAAVASLLGSIAGYLFFGSVLWAIKYISAAILICTVLLVFRETHIFESAWFMPLAASVITACVGFAGSAEQGWALSSTALLLTDVVLAGGSAYFYTRALSPWTGNFEYEYNSEVTHSISVLILLSTVVLALSGIVVFDVMSVGRMLAVLMVFLCSYMGGVGIGCTAGVAIGLAMDAASGSAPIFAAAYGFAGLLSGIFSKRGKLAFSVVFILVNSAAGLLAAESAGGTSILYEAFAASVIFMVLPASFISRLGALLPTARPGTGAVRAREYTKSRVEQASLAFSDLYETVREKSGLDRNDADAATVFDRAAETVCRKCARASDCWHSGYESTLDVMNNATPVMLERGSVEESDFPDFFTGECLHLKDYITAINAELRGLLYRRQYRNRLRENQSAAFNQYSEVSSILSEISQELGSGVRPEPDLEERLGKYLQSQGVLAEAAVFRDRGGRLHAEITGPGLTQLRRDDGYLEKLSAALGVRICTSESRPVPDKLTLLEAEPLAAAVGISCIKKAGQTVCGDKGAYFKTDEGILYVILSDGMGTGELAARCSGDAVRILERFLRSGVAAETSVRMLNDLFLLKNEDDTGCATIDLVSVNLFSGETSFFKYGAAPSYLRQGDAIRRVRAKSLAAGLGSPPHSAPDHVKMELKPGSVAVLVSDGVTSGAEDGWLEDILMHFEGDNPRELSKSIIDDAVEKNGNEDDMTVITIQMSRRP